MATLNDAQLSALAQSFRSRLVALTALEEMGVHDERMIEAHKAFFLENPDAESVGFPESVKRFFQWLNRQNPAAFMEAQLWLHHF